MAVHAALGLLLGLLGLVLPINVLRDGTFFLWWRLLPAGGATTSLGFPVVQSLAEALGASLLGLVWLVVALYATPAMAQLQESDALLSLATTCPVPVWIDAEGAGRSAAVEATAYFVVAEALTNVAEHTAAQRVTVTLRRADDRLRLAIVDGGHGGADASTGSGLIGIAVGPRPATAP